MNLHKLLQISKAVAKNLGISTGKCRYTPTCSLYITQAYSRHNFIYASWLSGKRLLKCHPWSPGGYNPVP